MIKDQKDYNSISESMLSSLESNDLSKLVIPRPIDLSKLLGNSHTDNLQLLAKQMTESLLPHQSILESMAPQLSQIAVLIQKQYQPQLEAFQLALSKFQPFISNAELLSKQLQALPIPLGLTSDAMITLSSFNSFQRVREVYEEYDEGNPLISVNVEGIRKAIAQNTELLDEVKKLIATQSQNGLQPGDIPELIYSYLVKKIPFLDKKTYGFIVLLFTAILFTYERYTDYKLGEKIQEIYDQQVEADKTTAKIDQKTERTEKGVNEIGDNINSMSSKITEVDSKLDLIIEEIRKHENVK